MNKDILDLIRGSAAMGAAETLRRLKPADDRISQTKARREYGSAFLRDHADSLTVTANGNRLEYSRAELEQLRAAQTVAMLALRMEYATDTDNKFKNK